MGNKVSKTNSIDPLNYQSPNDLENNNAKVTIDKSINKRFNEYKITEHSQGDNHPIEPNLNEKLEAIHTDISLILKELQKTGQLKTDQSQINNFQKHVTVTHILDWLNDWKSNGVEKPVIDTDKERMNIIIEYINNTRVEKEYFDKLLESEKDDELRKFLQDELNPSKQSSKGKVKFSAIANAIRFSQKLSRKSSFKKNTLEYDIPANLIKYLDLLTSFEFNIFDFAKDCNNEKVLYYMSNLVFKHYNLVDKFSIPMEKLKICLAHTNSLYHNNPYHSEIHVADVLQTSVYFMNGERIKRLLSDLDILAVVISVIFHDIDHPGVSNTFEQKTLTERAIRYNDVSILENHHCATAFQILLNDNLGIFQFFNDNQKLYLRKAIIFLILGTDISQHFSSVNTMKENLLKDFDATKEEHIFLMMKMIIKSADVSNPVKKFHISSVWVDKITEEFFNQGDKERALNLPISAFCDRENPSKPKSQIGFMQYIVNPLYQVLTEFDTSLSICIKTMQENLAYWQNELNKTTTS